MPKQHQTELAETGDIFFLYRPKVNEDDPSSIDDVQRFYFVLRPHDGSKLRLCAAGRKRLPEIDRHERTWGFVDAIAHDARSLESSLREETYETKTRGEQHTPAARPAGEGVYAISLEDGQMHLAYALELPDKPGEVQRSFKIAPEASFALSIKNPEAGQPKGAGLEPGRKPDYSDRLQKAFRGRRFASEDVRLLDHEGTEFILVGARRNPEEAYGEDLDAESESEKSTDVVKQLHFRKSEHPMKPLFEGEWN